MKTYRLKSRLRYDGSQMSSNWAYRTLGVEGESMVAFVGECDIPPSLVIDIEDLRSHSRIYSRMMLHFILERFDRDLENVMLRQRLLAAIVKEILEEKTGRVLTRSGDDIYDGRAKLTISVATLTTISSKIHFGINVIGRGAPVRAKGLSDYRIPPASFADAVMRRFAGEMEGLDRKKSHVRGVL